MAKVNRPGIFHATVKDSGVDLEGESPVVKFAFSICEEKVNGQFVNVSAEGMEAAKWVFLYRKDGQVSKPFLALYDIFPQWNGQDLFWFQDTDLTEHMLQITCDYNDAGEQIDVQFMNPYGSTGGGGGITKADADARRKISTMTGSTLRALARPAPANAAPPVTAPPKQKAPPAPPTDDTPPAAPPLTPADSTLEEAWATFSDACPDTLPQGEQEAIWFSIIRTLFDGKSQDDLTPAEWGRMNAECVANIPPF